MIKCLEQGTYQDVGTLQISVNEWRFVVVHEPHAPGDVDRQFHNNCPVKIFLLCCGADVNKGLCSLQYVDKVANLVVNVIIHAAQRTKLEEHAERLHTETAQAHDVGVYHTTVIR